MPRTIIKLGRKSNISRRYNRKMYATGSRSGRYRNRTGVKTIMSYRNQTHFFKRNFSLGAISIVPGTNPALGGMSFRFNQLSNFQEFVDMFDRYCITGIKVNFIFPCITQTFVNGVIPQWPRIYTVIDYDDDSVPASIDDLREYQTCRYTQYTANKLIHSVYFTPRVATPVYNGITLVPAFEVARPKKWIDLSSTAVPHFGLKYGIENALTLEQDKVSMLIECVMYFKTTDVR